MKSVLSDVCFAGLFIFSFLPPQFQEELFSLTASGVDRTIMSAQALMLGMYPPGSGPIDNSTGIPFSLPGRQAVFPIFTTSHPDALLRADSDCSSFIGFQRTVNPLSLIIRCITCRSVGFMSCQVLVRVTADVVIATDERSPSRLMAGPGPGCRNDRDAFDP